MTKDNPNGNPLDEDLVDPLAEGADAPSEIEALIAERDSFRDRFMRALADADLIIARNLDLALIALAARRLAALRAGKRPAPLVYECLDIHDLMTAPGRKGQIMRLAERRVLANAALVTVSSPGFTENYFRPVQGYHGPVALVENKLWLDPALHLLRPQPAPHRRGPARWPRHRH
jgi:hypothetical protein